MTHKKFSHGFGGRDVAIGMAESRRLKHASRMALLARVEKLLKDPDHTAATACKQVGITTDTLARLRDERERKE